MFRILRELKFKIKKLKSFFVRGCHGWSPMDTWSFDIYLAVIISDGIKYLRKNTRAHPVNLSEEEWEEILEKIEIGFKIYVSSLDCSFTPREEERIKESLELFIKYFSALWD